MIIEIDYENIDILLQMFESDKVAIGKQITIPGNANCKFINHNSSKGIVFEGSTTLEFLITFSSGAASSLIASWIYDKLKGKVKTIRINKKIVELNRGKLQKFVEESIKVEL